MDDRAARAVLRGGLNTDGFGAPEDRPRRLREFCDAYGTTARAAVVDLAHARLLAMVDDIRRRAEAGDAAFRRHVDEGHDGLYLRDAEYLLAHRDALLAGADATYDR